MFIFILKHPFFLLLTELRFWKIKWKRIQLIIVVNGEWYLFVVKMYWNKFIQILKDDVSEILTEMNECFSTLVNFPHLSYQNFICILFQQSTLNSLKIYFSRTSHYCSLISVCGSLFSLSHFSFIFSIYSHLFHLHSRLEHASDRTTLEQLRKYIKNKSNYFSSELCVNRRKKNKSIVYFSLRNVDVKVLEQEQRH